ncbi:MAG: hypothetical protein BWY70_00660 [Bacteroidetes bacterium ADurb.Bin408]|nr:MAG: hypothetical protein BWY70_00660 [Bacteroidetes bacterium ADurb.Bin408]
MVSFAVESPSTLTGSNNTFAGVGAGISTISGNNNAFYGYQAAYQNTSGYQNTAIGKGTLYSNKANYRSTALGYHAMYYADDRTGARATYNTAVGFQALAGSTTASANSGRYNTAVGDNAMFQHTNGNYNVAIGRNALQGSVVGYSNVAVGSEALYTTDAYNNTAVGYRAGYNNYSGYGNVFIGTQAGESETGSNKLYIENSATTAPLIGGDFSGRRVGINRMPTTYTLEVGGTIWANGQNIVAGINTWSDVRYKKDIRNLDSSLYKISCIRGVSYDWKESDFPELNFPKGRQIGVIAQEVEKILPQVVFTDVNGYKSISYEKFTPVLIEAVKEQQGIINRQDEQIQQLQQNYDNLLQELNNIKKQLPHNKNNDYLIQFFCH